MPDAIRLGAPGAVDLPALRDDGPDARGGSSLRAMRGPRLMTTPARPADLLDEPLLGPRDLAARLGVPTSWVYANAEAGRLPSFRLGKYLRFRASEVAAWLEQQRRGNGAGR